MELGKKIKHLRLKAGLTQEQLADQLGIGPQSVSK
ncbi:MAG: helix-turn-helix transcriptional regulator [Clostridia bacterium]|nr:helix-turn-helix transcriptional regulator [Clostridia bacterium]